MSFGIRAFHGADFISFGLGGFYIIWYAFPWADSLSDFFFPSLFCLVFGS